MNTASVTSRLMPLPEVAEALGVSIYTVRRLVEAGEISAVRIGARVMVNAEVVARIQREGAGTRRSKRPHRTAK